MVNKWEKKIKWYENNVSKLVDESNWIEKKIGV